MVHSLANPVPRRHRPASLAVLLAIVTAMAFPSTAIAQRRKAKADKKAATPMTKLSLWVPAYYYPNGLGLREWDRLIAAAKLVPVVAIVNPASGPGDHVDPYIAKVITRRSGNVKSWPISEPSIRANRWRS